MVRVGIEVMEACGSCASRKACAMGTSDRREIVAHTSTPELFSVGEVVNVVARCSMGAMAVLLCYVLPLIVLVAALALAVTLGCSEGVAAVMTLSMLALYYAVLAAFRNKIAGKVVFTINKISLLSH